MSDSLLRTALLDLLHTLGDRGKRILLGGGYGLYLKQLHLAQLGARTLIAADLWPAPRATQDLDLMLPAELIADAHSMTAVRNALDKLGYRVVKGSEYLQFNREVGATQMVKVDLLTAQLDVLTKIPTISADSRRARPAAADRPRLHAHPTDGALSLTEAPLVLDVAGKLSSGADSIAPVTIPHSFTYLLMKLTAYRDRRNDPDMDLGRHHALDVFRIIAMLTESEYEEALAKLRHHRADTQVRSCVELVRTTFNSATAPGVLAMREHPLWQNDPQLAVFLKVIAELVS